MNFEKKRPVAKSKEESQQAPEQLAMVYWNGVLDAQNLDACEAAAADTRIVEREIAWADAPDLRAAAQWLSGAKANGKAGGAKNPASPIIDLGAGLGAHSFALARRGHRVIAADASLARLRSLRRRARAVELSDRVFPVVADAHALPFASDAVAAAMTKSMLIHTDMKTSAAEIARVLAPGGRATLIEPQTGNPFVALYRRVLAPKAWAGITTYFNRDLRAIYAGALPGGRHGVRYCYFFAFFAHVFQFALPSPILFKIAMGPLNAMDRALFIFAPVLRRFAWFGMICLEKEK